MRRTDSTHGRSVPAGRLGDNVSIHGILDARARQCSLLRRNESARPAVADFRPKRSGAHIAPIRKRVSVAIDPLQLSGGVVVIHLISPFADLNS